MVPSSYVCHPDGVLLAPALAIALLFFASIIALALLLLFSCFLLLELGLLIRRDCIYGQSLFLLCCRDGDGLANGCSSSGCSVAVVHCRRRRCRYVVGVVLSTATD